MSATPARLDLQGITKRYPSVVANDSVSLSVAPGQIHAVLGENGAGKSTLMKIIYGAVQADAGAMRFDGTPMQVGSPRAARALGVSMVFQHFSLFDTLTVAENIWLGLDTQHKLAELEHEIDAKARAYGLQLEPQRPVHTLSVGERQRVEIVRALLSNPKLLILDEPTSVLTPQAVESLFATLRQLSAEGCSILYISHKLHEIRALCDSCTVLRGGKVSGRCDPRHETNESLSRLMIGAEPPKLASRAHAQGPLVLQVQGLSLPKDDQFGTDLRDIALQVRAGEIVGIAGVSGNGQQELLRALSGEDTRAASDAVRVAGASVGGAHANARRALGLHFVPEERLGRGAVPTHALASNMLLTRRESLKGAWINPKALAAQAQGVIARFGVKASGPQAAAKSLSGGNLQKFIVGREISANPKLLIVAQPTWGVDVGAAAQIHQELLNLRDAGCAVLVVSEELDELFALTDRLYVIAQGRLSPSVATADASVEQIGAWMSGLWNQPQSQAQERARVAA
jgi:general nucleoside transport system ATP-binding protein